MNVRTKAEQSALDIIKNESAVVKVIGDADFFLNQLADPTKYRPSRSLYFYSSMWSMERPKAVIKFNPKNR